MKLVLLFEEICSNCNKDTLICSCCNGIRRGQRCFNKKAYRGLGKTKCPQRGCSNFDQKEEFNLSFEKMKKEREENPNWREDMWNSPCCNVKTTTMGLDRFCTSCNKKLLR